MALAASLLFVAGCRPPAAPPGATTRPTVVSLVPAATDLIVGMNAADHLVGVSNFDRRSGPTAELPRVGDYANIDWERIAWLRPNLMIVFMDPDRMPAALHEKAGRYGVRLANVRIERLGDVFAQARAVGQLLNESDKAGELCLRLETQLDSVRRRCAGKPKVPALMVREPSLLGVVGRDNFLNDLLELAGGENVILTPGWPEIDKEMLVSVRPKIIIHLMPEADAAMVSRARLAWDRIALPEQVRKNVHILTEWHLLQGGVHVGATAEALARLLHAE